MISHKEHKDHKEFSMCLYVFYVAKNKKGELQWQGMKS